MSWVRENMTDRNKEFDRILKQLEYDDYLKNNPHILCIECRKVDGIQMCLSRCELEKDALFSFNYALLRLDGKQLKEEKE